MILQLARHALRIPTPLLWPIARRRAEPVRGHRLDPQVRAILQLADWIGKRHTHDLSVAEARASLDEASGLLAPPEVSLASVLDRAIDGPGGPLTLRIYRPRGLVAPSPLLVYLHGGGWVLGNLTSHDRVCRSLADRARCVIVAVDYRLAPEHRFPAAVEDSVAAWRWVHAHAAELGGRPGAVAIGGDSAGGNLSAVVCQALRGESAQPSLQLLIYPATDLSREAASYTDFGQGYLLPRETMVWFREHYVGDAEAARDLRVSPLLCEDLSGLPPAIVVTAGFDVLCDEGDAYADRLLAAGVRVEHRRFPTLPHGFMSMSGGVGAARRAFAETAEALRSAQA